MTDIVTKQIAGILSTLDFTPETMIQRHLTGPHADAWKSALRKLLDGEPVWAHTAPNFPFGTTIEVGGMTSDQLIEAMLAQKMGPSGYARHLLAIANAEPGEVHTASFAYAKVKDITESGQTSELFDRQRLKALGLELCRPSDVAYLRIAHRDQRPGSFYFAAMPPITLEGGPARIFSIGNDIDGRTWLHAAICDETDPGSRWQAEDGFVFRVIP
ncbi:hypothetical protein [Novosphingobium malaysiense]|uniref:Uncharacterized protein n=1 Tax=Novosphingobium malaysiense TaxID=1348853 RepID=A0A0B1ZMD7_9SPHN|nr:hypothetical protein [Novosphingobium malaysiense]KHK90353.1 hypothetical protein LK12_17300 [Novosphingobium malaysiense]